MWGLGNQPPSAMLCAANRTKQEGKTLSERNTANNHGQDDGHESDHLIEHAHKVNASHVNKSIRETHLHFIKIILRQYEG